MAWALVTPSSRGIGFALVRQLLKTTPSSVPIVATTRGDKAETRERLLSNLDLADTKVSNRIDVQHCDLLSESSIQDLSSYCKERYQSRSDTSHLRLGFCIPGMLNPERSPAQIDYDLALDTLKLNLLSPMMLLKHFHSFLPRKFTTNLGHIDGLPNSAVLAFMSARVGSTTDNFKGGWYSYRASKAGVTQLAKAADKHVPMQIGDKAAVVALHPGTVKTDLSKEFWSSIKDDQLFSPEFAAERLCEVVQQVGDENHIKEMRGKCWDWAGKEVPP